jgi:hypothetical protein
MSIAPIPPSPRKCGLRTSGHRGSSSDKAFNEPHIPAIGREWLAGRDNRPGFDIFDCDIYAICGYGWNVLRVGDNKEVVEAHRYIMQLRLQPAVLAPSRQPLPTLDRSKLAAAAKGSSAGVPLLKSPWSHATLGKPGIDPAYLSNRRLKRTSLQFLPQQDSIRKSNPHQPPIDTTPHCGYQDG